MKAGSPRIIGRSRPARLTVDAIARNPRRSPRTMAGTMQAEPVRRGPSPFDAGSPTMTKQIAMILGLAIVALAGCENKGPAQRAGASVDRGVQDVKDAVNPPGPVEKAGRAVDRAVNP
jgi:hypothetical protein